MMKRLLIFIIISGCCVVCPGMAGAGGILHVRSSQLKGPLDASVRVDLAWSELQDKRYQVFYQYLAQGAWSEKIRLTDNTTMDHVAPAITTDAGGTVWIVWTVADGTKSRLMVTTCRGPVCVAARQVPSPFSSNTGASIAIDTRGTPWLVWSASDTGADAIVFSRRRETKWDAPQRISKEDEYPDILPVIGLGSDGWPWVCWTGYDGKRYREYASSWTGREWGEETSPAPRNLYDDVGVRQTKSIPPLPEFSFYPVRVAVHMTTWTAIQSLPVKLEDE